MTALRTLPASRDTTSEAPQPRSITDSGTTMKNANLLDKENDTTVAVDTAAPTVAAAADVPPNGGYGWVCVAAVFVINAHTWGEWL